MEGFLDQNVNILKDKITGYCDRGEVFDLKKLLHYYTIDVLGELAFSQSFSVQATEDESLVPPVEEHILLSSTTGAWPVMTKLLKKWLPNVPVEGLQKLFRGRAACAQLASTCVDKRLAELKDAKGEDVIASGGRKDLLTNLILAKHPDTGERLTRLDLETESFGFM